MVVGEPNINNIMGGIENTGSVRLHNHRKKLKQRFDIIKKLGQGTYGKVQLGINKETGQEVAIKTIKKSKIETEADLIRIRREIQIMSSVQHPNIIHIYEVFENREKMVLVMEYAAGGELYDYLSERRILAEEEARRIFRQIATACYYCHKHKICHRDLKLENILLDENGNAKIADFGLSNVFDERRLLSTFCGSPLYASPEIVKGTPYQGPEVDCWSLGVLLYTLVYGAMPFDGSNFKRLVRQISQGDYFEPKKPSRASPLIREMLTVNPKNRASIEKICSHWWVNETYDVCCLDISEELANQTPVRLDLLLSLAPPPPQLESEKLVVTGEIAEGAAIAGAEGTVPMRSQSTGSIIDVERRTLDDSKLTPKRKLESTVSTDQANLSREGIKRKEKIVKESTVADITLHTSETCAIPEEPSLSPTPSSLDKSSTHTVISPSMEIEHLTAANLVDVSTQGAACAEIIETEKVAENKRVSSGTVPKEKQKETEKENVIEQKGVIESGIEDKQKPESKIPAKRKVVKKKVLTDKNENLDAKSEVTPAPSKSVETTTVKSEQEETSAQPLNKPVERRRSRIFETTEKFQNMISSSEPKPSSSVVEKPKKIVIPGVSVGGFKKEFERKASLTGTSKIGLTKKASVEKDDGLDKKEEVPAEVEKPASPPPTVSSPVAESDQDKSKRVQIQNAVSVISNAIEGTRKSKSKPCIIRKPPVPFGFGGRSASGSIPTVPYVYSPPPNLMQPLSDEFCSVQGSVPARVLEQNEDRAGDEDQTSSAEITLKSATLPRRKTTKAEIKLDYPLPKPATMGFKTEMAHRIEAAPSVPSEVTIPLKTNSSAYEPTPIAVENKPKQTSRERIIPISFELEAELQRQDSVTSPPPNKPPVVKPFQSQRSTVSQRTNSLSRQSTQDSDSETATSVSTGEPIRKSPREYIIPIAVEGGGYVTPRAGSLEPGDGNGSIGKSKFGRSKLFGDRDGSEDESSPFANLHRHYSFGRDSDAEDSRRDLFRMHSLRSSRPTRKTMLEHNDSFSSGEDDDDDGFELLTAENLFSTLLSRVRDLTQKLNVDGRPGFPTSRLLSSHFDTGSNFWNRMDPLSRHTSIGRNSREQSVDRASSMMSRASLASPWRRSASRDLGSDIDSVLKGGSTDVSSTHTLPRGDINDSNNDNLNLSDLNLRKLKLSDQDALALSYLTPGLSRRIQKQLFAQLAPSEARKLSRTLSLRSTSRPPLEEEEPTETTAGECSADESTTSWRSTATLPRLSSSNVVNATSSSTSRPKRSSCLPVKRAGSDLNGTPVEKLGSRSSSFASYTSSLTPSYELEPKSTNVDTLRRRSRFLRSDFFNGAKEEDDNYYLREKKERELETQKVLKEIRDRRKGRSVEPTDKEDLQVGIAHTETDASTDSLLKRVSDSIKCIESNVNDKNYVENAQSTNGNDIVCESTVQNRTLKKERPSKIARPKSYPNEAHPGTKVPELEKKAPKSKKTEHQSSTESEKSGGTKNKLLHSIEKKFEKLRSFSNSPSSVCSGGDEKKSLVEDTIKRLREQSLPRNIDSCITESGFLKRAVSVEDMAISDSSQLQPSRKSVTKILNLFKKYEEKNGKKSSEKSSKVKKAANKDESSPSSPKKNGKDESTKKTKSKTPRKEKSFQVAATENLKCNPEIVIKDEPNKKRLERPRSLMLPNAPVLSTFAKSLPNDEDTKSYGSKLPVMFQHRRSLNLETPSNSNTTNTPNYDGNQQYHTLSPNNNYSSYLLSPHEESNDGWSVCSDHHHEPMATSPLSPCGANFYSADESNESVSERIRRKSFYTRFNEKKRPRRTSSTTNYRDLDLYKDMAASGQSRRRDYARSSTTPFGDGLERLSDERYRTYAGRSGRRATSVYSFYPEETATFLDNDDLTTETNRNYYIQQPSTRYADNSNLADHDLYAEPTTPIPTISGFYRSSGSLHKS